MIEFYVSGQTLKFYTPVIAADTLNYLTAKVNFSGNEWDGYSKWLHFRQGEELGADVFDLQLNENDEITADQQLNLDIGEWEIYLTGTKDESRLTTVPVILTVKESGLIDAPLHGLPMSVAERVDFNAAQALLLAQAVKDMADAGDFDGKPGTSFAPLGYYSSAEELAAAVTEPAPGDVYGVGTEVPYDMYSWDGVNLVWINNGPIQGAAGEKGERGVTFTPSVDANGNISWVNDGGLANPQTQNIRGPAGADGAAGPAGPGAYEKATEAGYTGTEATFYQALTAMPYHNARHLPDGADPIKVQSGNIENGAVTRAKLAQDALYTPFYILPAAENVLTVSMLGKHIRDNSNFSTNNITINPDSTIPVGAVFPIVFLFTSKVTITFGEKTKVYHLDYNNTVKKFSVAKRGMAALQKVAASGGEDYWYITGNVEAVE